MTADAIVDHVRIWLLGTLEVRVRLDLRSGRRVYSKGDLTYPRLANYFSRRVNFKQKCRGFAFVTVKTSEQADQVLEKFNGYVFKESPLKIEKALPRSKGKEEESRVSSSPEASGSSNSPRHSSKTKSRRSDSSYGGNQSEAVQPDPRWAQELEKLKQLLAAQASNS